MSRLFLGLNRTISFADTLKYEKNKTIFWGRIRLDIPESSLYLIHNTPLPKSQKFLSFWPKIDREFPLTFS